MEFTSPIKITHLYDRYVEPTTRTHPLLSYSNIVYHENHLAIKQKGFVFVCV